MPAPGAELWSSRAPRVNRSERVAQLARRVTISAYHWSSRAVPRDTVPSACPHDCPSTCALEVERLGPERIGRVHGSRRNAYTAGVICAKVARYADRVHHPDRLTQPLLRVGDKGVGRAAFRPIGWEEALDRVAEGMGDAALRHGPEAVFP